MSYQEESTEQTPDMLERLYLLFGLGTSLPEWAGGAPDIQSQIKGRKCSGDNDILYK